MGAFAAGAYTDAPRTYWLGALLPVVVAIVDLTADQSVSAGDYIFPSLVFLTGWFVGRLVHGRAQVAAPARAADARSSSASATSSPRPPSPASARGSRASCTTSSRTASRRW